MNSSLDKHLTLLLTTGVMFVGAKLGIPSSVLGMTAAMIVGVLLHSSLGQKLEASKAAQAIDAVVSDVAGAVQAAEGASASAAAAQAPSKPSASQS